ncbi:MAG: T9SS type A sorting domain-containing protein [Bacteroidales bacterium]|nr:T9SS type A sorting domain-containing protein [Bacteroidales bacterium]
MSSFTKHCTIFFFTFISSFGFSQTINWDWVRSAGGVSDDVGFSITNDHNNNILIVGKIVSVANFDSLAIASMTYNGGGFIAKYDSSGNVLWVNGISGTRTTAVQSIATDLNNNVYVCGHFTETTYVDTFSLTSNGSSDAFIGKYSANGNLLWIKSAGGIDLDGAMSLICSDSLLFVAGEFKDGIYFDTTLLVSSSVGNSDIFLACLDFNGNYKWVRQAGGNGWDVSRGIDIDNSSNIYLTGIFMETAYFDSLSVYSDGSGDAFLAKYDTNGNIHWVTPMLGTSHTWGRSVITCNDNIFVMGHFEGNVQFGSYNMVSQGYSDYFISKLDEYGNILWAKQITTTLDFIDDFWNHSLESDEQGNIYITGYFMDSLVYDSFSVQSNGSYDIFVMKIDNDGDLIWCLTAGNDHSYGDYSRSITRDNNGNLFITGRFYDTLCFGDSCVTSNGSADIFIAKISETPLNIEFVKETMQIDIFPNPASSFLNIISDDNEIQEVEIIDNNGKCISGYKDSDMSHIDVSDLSKGMYFVRVIYRNITITRKIIII